MPINPIVIQKFDQWKLNEESAASGIAPAIPVNDTAQTTIVPPTTPESTTDTTETTTDNPVDTNDNPANQPFYTDFKTNIETGQDVTVKNVDFTTKEYTVNGITYRLTQVN